MVSMTMVFQMVDAAMLAKVKVCDKAKFEANRVNGAIMGRDQARNFIVRPFRTEIGI